MTELLAVALAYGIGSIPISWLIFYWRSGGRDLRAVGDHNVGSANAMKQGVGRPWGHVALLSDIGKGLLAVSVARWLDLPVGWWVACGYIVILAHMFPVWLRFRGGRGAATAVGAVGAFLPWQFGITMSAATGAFFLFHIAEIGILVAAAPLPFIAIAADLPVAAIVFCFTAPVLAGLKAAFDRWRRLRSARAMSEEP